jgi:hypothetical protein
VENRALLDEYEEEKISFPSPEFDLRNVQPVASLYADCAVSAPVIILDIYRCPRRNVPYFGRVFLMLNYTDITQNTYIQS